MTLTRRSTSGFHAEILNDHAAIRQEEENYKSIPAIRKISHYDIEQNYFRIKGTYSRSSKQN